MTEQQFTQIQNLKKEIWHLKDDIRRIDEVLTGDFASNISFTRGGNSFSFGSKKFDFKEDLNTLLKNCKEKLEKELKEKEEEFKNI